MSLIVVGSIAFDSVETPTGRADTIALPPSLSLAP